MTKLWFERAAAVNPSLLAIAGLFFTFVGAAFFLALKQLLPFDNALLIIAISLALIGIALMARRGYVSAGAFQQFTIVFERQRCL